MRRKDVRDRRHGDRAPRRRRDSRKSSRVRAEQAPARTRRRFEMPANCPVCGSAVVRVRARRARCTGGLYLRGAAQAGAAAFRRRRAMDIEGLGEKLVDQLVERELVRNAGRTSTSWASPKLDGARAHGGEVGARTCVASDRARASARRCSASSTRSASATSARRSAKILARHFGALEALLRRRLAEADGRQGGDSQGQCAAQEALRAPARRALEASARSSPRASASSSTSRTTAR